MANENVEVARGYHEQTKHSEERLRANPHHLDWDNQPIPFKLYRDLETIPLPRQLEPGTVSALRALSASVGRETEPTEQVPGLQALARVLYYSAGITKVRRSPGGDVYFRAASNTGALYHVDLYLACRDLPDLPAGIYHFGVHDFALRRLRVSDYRGAFIESAGTEPSLAQAPVVVASASTYWRNAWKYRDRAYRHAFWDAGTLHANLLAVAAAQGLAPEVVAGFVDRDVERLLGLDPAREGALALVPLGRTAEPPAPAPDAPVLNLETEPLSSRETEYPAIRELHGASRLEHGEEVARWGRVVLPRPEPDSRSDLFPRGRVRSERLVLSQTSRKATCSDTGPHAPTHCGTRRCSDRAADDGGVCLWREEPLAYFEGPRSPTAAHLSLKGVGSGPFSSLRLAAVAELAAHSAAWEGGVVHVHVVLLRMVDDAWSRAGSTFSPQPLVGGIRGTTLGPFTPAGATWMWAPNAGAMLETEISQQTLACPTLSVIDANPVPSGSAGGTPSVVAGGGAPPPARGRSFRPVQARARHSQGSITERYMHAAQVPFPGAAEKSEARMFGPARLSEDHDDR